MITEKENIHLDNGHSFKGVLDFDEIEIGSKEGSEVRDEIVARDGEVRKRFIIGFKGGVRVRGPEEDTVGWGGGNSVKVGVVIGCINGSKANKGLDISDEGYIIAASHTRKGGRQGGIVYIGEGAGEHHQGAVKEQGGSGKARAGVGACASKRREEGAGLARTELGSRGNMGVGNSGIGKHRVLETK